MNPWAQVGAILAESKRSGLVWEDGWDKAMRSLSPERTTVYGPLVRKGLAEDRDLLRECEPWLRAAYENRDVTVDEFEKAQARTERRLDAVMALA